MAGGLLLRLLRLRLERLQFIKRPGEVLIDRQRKFEERSVKWEIQARP